MEGFDVDREIDQGVERAYRADVARFGSFNAQVFGLTIDAFTRRALVVDELVEGALAIQCHTHQPTCFQVDVFDAAFVLAKLLMGTGLTCWLGIEERTAIALCPETIGMLELVGRMHTQTDGTQRGAIGIALIDGMSMLVERDGGDTSCKRYLKAKQFWNKRTKNIASAC